MNRKESEDVESAYGSEISSNSDFIIKKDSFKIEEPTPPKNQNRWECLKLKLREFMILEAIFFLILVFLLFICYRISSQNQETQRMILSIKSQLNSFQKPIQEDLMNMKGETENMNKNESEKTEAMLEDDFLTGKEFMNMEEGEEEQEEQEQEQEQEQKEVVELEQSEPISKSTENSKKPHAPSIFPIEKFNAASLMEGATIDKSLSSSSNLYSSLYRSSVLVDRPEPPANEAWCTYDKNPVLTVNLGYFIKPTAVSYQHSKWNGTIPDVAPKEYSVEACLDESCYKRKPLFSHCEYNSNGLQEQICNNTPHDPIKSQVGKVQFRFHKNHGNTERTCVSLVRVYSEKVLPEQNMRWLEDTTTCLNLKHHYRYNTIIYKYFIYMNCDLLYSEDCCQACPECCEECDIEDNIEDIINPDSRSRIFPFVVIIPLFIFMLLLCFFVSD